VLCADEVVVGPTELPTYQTDIAALTGDLASLSRTVDSHKLEAIEGGLSARYRLGPSATSRGSNRIGEIKKRVEVSSSGKADGTRDKDGGICLYGSRTSLPAKP
jgi:hypothetical protein